MVFSSAAPTPNAYTANMESSPNADYLNSTTNRTNWELFDHSDPTTDATDYSQKLTGGNGSQVGVAKTFKVYPGDKVKIEAYAKYYNPTSTGSNLSSFAGALLTAFGLAPPVGGESGTPAAAVNTWGSIVGSGSGNGNTGYPKAFVNLLVFDKNYKYLDIGWDQLNGGEQVGVSPKAAHDYMTQEYTAKEEGYIYVYVSNENATLVEVYFDDVVVTHTKSNIVQYNEYYPFGLQTANSWTRENTTGNNFLGNGGTELNATSNLYDLEYRNYDPVLGRMNGVDPLATKFASVSPYNFSFNDPVSLNDPSGAVPETINHGARNSGWYTSYTYDDRVDYYRGEYISGGSTSALLFSRNGMNLRYGDGGSGGWVAQFGNLRIDYNSLEDGLSIFGFSDGQVSSYFHGDQSMALAYGALYNDRHNSWGYTAYGGEIATTLAYGFAKQNGGRLPSRTQLGYWLKNPDKILRAWQSRQQQVVGILVQQQGTLDRASQAWQRLTKEEKQLAGQYPIAALTFFKNMMISEDETVRLFGRVNHNNAGDAFRHAYWNALNARDLGWQLTNMFSDAHESESLLLEPMQALMDLYNNTMGMKIGNNSNYNDDELAFRVYNQVLNGNLYMLDSKLNLIKTHWP